MYKLILKEHWFLIFINLISLWVSFISFPYKTTLFIYDFLSNLSYGIVVSTIFYVFVVIIPDINKSRTSAKMFLVNYEYFKRQLIQIFLRSLYRNSFRNLPSSEDLLDVKKFREIFKSNQNSPNWYDLANSLNERDTILIAQGFKTIHTQLRHFLDNSNLDNKNIQYFSTIESIFMHYSSSDIINLDEDLKSFLRNLWGIFAAYDIGSGYSDEDFIEKRLKLFI